MKKLTLALVFLGLAAFNKASANSDAKTAADAMGASVVSEVKFKSGEMTLPSESLAEVANAINSAKGAGEIREVRIISWADQEYPAKGTMAPNTSIKLAEERADYLKKYLKEDLKVSSVKTHNMAKRPNAVQSFLNTPSAKTKRTLEVAGAAPSTKDDTGFLGLQGKASSALVLVYLK